LALRYWEITAASDCSLATAKAQFTTASAQEAGILKELRVKDGDWVEQGSVLGVCEDLELEKQNVRLIAEIEQAQSRLTALQSQLAEQQANVEQAQSLYTQKKLESDELLSEENAILAHQAGKEISSDYPPELLELRSIIRAKENEERAQKLEENRFEFLFQQGLVGEFLVESARNRRQIAELDRRAAEERLLAAQIAHRRKTKKATTEEKLANQSLNATVHKLTGIKAEMVLNSEQIQAKRTELTLLEKKRQGLNIRALQSGLVLAPGIEKKLGQYFSRGMEFCQVADISQLQAVAEISERDITSIQLGNVVRFRLRSLPDRTFAGKVSYISNEAIFKPDTNSRIYNCEIVVDNKDKFLRPGMSGVLRITVGRERGYQRAWHWLRRNIKLEYLPW
jgi:multidrug resistance efflux pump